MRYHDLERCVDLIVQPAEQPILGWGRLDGPAIEMTADGIGGEFLVPASTLAELTHGVHDVQGLRRNPDGTCDRYTLTLDVSS